MTSLNLSNSNLSNSQLRMLQQQRQQAAQKSESVPDNAQNKAPIRNFVNIPEYKVETQTGVTTNKTISSTNSAWSNGGSFSKYDTREEALANAEKDLLENVFCFSSTQNVSSAFYDLVSDGLLDDIENYSSSGSIIDKTGILLPNVAKYSDANVVLANGGNHYDITITDVKFDVVDLQVKQDADGKWYVTGTVKLTLTYDVTTTSNWEVGEQYMDSDGYLFENTGKNSWKDLASEHNVGDTIEYNGNKYTLQQDGTWKLNLKGDEFKHNKSEYEIANNAISNKDYTMVYNNIQFTNAKDLSKINIIKSQPYLS